MLRSYMLNIYHQKLNENFHCNSKGVVNGTFGQTNIMRTHTQLSAENAEKN